MSLSSIALPYAAPIVALIIGARSPFIKFYAIRSLLQELALTAFTACLFACSLAWTIYSLAQRGFDLSTIDWRLLIFKTIALWLILLLAGAINTVRAVWDGVEALRGELPRNMRRLDRIAGRWAGLPSLDRLA